MWPRPEGSYRCTKVWVLLYPLLVHGRSQPPLQQGMARQRKTAEGKTCTKNIKTVARVVSSKRQAGPRPATSLPEVTYEAPDKPLAGAVCKVASTATTLGFESSNNINNDEDQDLKSTCLLACGSSRRSTTHKSTWDQMMKTPGKTLAGDDSTRQALSGTIAGP